MSLGLDGGSARNMVVAEKKTLVLSSISAHAVMRMSLSSSFSLV